MWRPTEKEIETWLKEKALEFVVKENRNPNHDVERWLQDYIYSNLHEIFFVELHNILTEWLVRLCEENTTWRIDGRREWTAKLVQQLKEISNPISHAVDFLLDSILTVYIIEFSIDYMKSYSATERELFQGPRAKYLRKLNVWIKIALRDRGTLPMKNDS